MGQIEKIEKTDNAIGKSVQKNPMLKFSPQSIEFSLSYVIFFIFHKMWFNFGDSFAKGVKMNR